MISRRAMIGKGALALAGGAVMLEALANRDSTLAAEGAAPPDQSNGQYTPVTTPNGSTLPFKIVDGVKVFHLIAEPVSHEFAPGLVVQCWGYNGRTPGPTIEVVEGDRCRFYVTNRLPAPTTVHWHGVRVPNGMDGANGLTQKSIAPGETYKYEFTIQSPGTYMYHPHYDEMTQQGMGMMGMFIAHRRQTTGPKVDRDFAIMLSEWRVDPGTSRPVTTEMTDFNLFTMNSKVYPATDPLVVKLGERVRIRLGNLSAMDHHPIHLHGYQFKVAETDGGIVPESAQTPTNSVFVAVGTTRVVEFVADAPGDWPMHCHMTHHVMNQMGHQVPNLIGVKTEGLDEKVQKVQPGYMTMGGNSMDGMAGMSMPVPKNSIPMLFGDGPFEVIDMGGMFTILKVRADIKNYDDPGWYQHPAGTVATNATAEELRRDGIDVGG